MTDSIEGIIAHAHREDRVYLLEHECKAILRSIGVPTTSCLVAGSEEEAVNMSEAIGYPIVLKILSPEVIHKSDAGGVKLNLGREEVKGAYSELIAKFTPHHPPLLGGDKGGVVGVSVQEMAEPGLEVIVGATRDATFGPVLMFGLGGVFVEVLKDVAFRVIPVTECDAQEMIEEIKGYQLLQGYRGQSADIASLRDILLKVSDLVAAYPDIKEVDLNPVFAYPKGSLVVDARMILDGPDRFPKPVRSGDLTAVFEPQSVAVVGASATPGKAGFNIVDNLLRLGYKGEVYPVNPKAEEILGLKAYPTVDQIPHQIDMAIIATPAGVVVDVMRDCARHALSVSEGKGIKAAIIISSGFSEESEEGRRLEEEVVAIAREADIRVLGPNTTGVFNPENKFTSSFIPVDRVASGNVAFIAQTGLFLGVLFEHILSSQRFGISKVAGMGNKADLDDADILEYLARDAQTKVVAMYIEGLSDGRRFLQVAREVTRKKPIVVLKSGTTEAGAEAALSHTASLAGRAEVFEAACKQAGILRVQSFEEMLDVVKAFSFLPLPPLCRVRGGGGRGNRVAVIHYTGAACVIAADACQREGLELAKFSPATVEALREITPTWHRIRNPVDLWPAIERHWVDTAYGAAIEAVLRDEGVDALVVSLFAMPRWQTYTPDFDLLRASGKPVIFCVEGNEELVREAVARIEGQGFPVYPQVNRAVFALSHLSKYKNW